MFRPDVDIVGADDVRAKRQKVRAKRQKIAKEIWFKLSTLEDHSLSHGEGKDRAAGRGNFSKGI
ncbi:MAG: hypothetical protein DWI02_04900 [Planctomycetota bacterium]|nr:MAG: hypothetical protein DWI02_04900 [Planctomycetota bacterium]